MISLGQLLIWFIGLFWTIVSAFAVVVIFYFTKLELACRKWPRVSGTIVKTVVRPDEDGPWDNGEINFSYRIGDDVHEGRSERRRSLRTNAKKAAAFLERYPVGKTIEIHYDPGNPSVTRIAPIPSFWCAVPGFVPLGVALAAGICVVVKWWPFN